MNFKLFSAAFCAALLAGTCAALAQDDAATGGLTKYPLAAKAGVDSHADKVAPPGAVNTGPFSDKTWKFGHRTDYPQGTPIWNPVKVKMMAGGKITSVTINGNDTPTDYCAAANSGVDFIWTEMQHSGGTWDSVQKMWTSCPFAKAIPGVRVPNANEFDEQHGLDLGALWLEIPTVRSIAEAQEAVKWAYYPPMGGRSAGSMTGINYRDVPGGYRNTINQNLVLTLMIETLAGLADADKIAALPGVSAVFAASSDLGNHSGYRAGDPDYEREINIVHDAALRAHKYLCGPYNWVDRPDFNCFQGPGGHVNVPVGVDPYAAYSDAAKKALGPLWNTQGKVTAGPYAPGFMPSPPGRPGRPAPAAGGG
jgi:2-keto-3-deoxy-L-rhamnonate aldolase RhmA